MSPQDIAHLLPAAQVGGKLLPVVAQPTKVDDTADPGRPCRRAEVLRGLTVLFREVTASLHGVNEVVGRVHATHRLVQTGGSQHVAGDNFSVARDAGAQEFRLPGQAANASSLCFERFKQAAANVTGGAG